MDSSVGAHFGEEGMRGEVVRAGMFEDEEASGAEDVATQDGFGKLGQSGESIGRIGEDEVEGRGGAEVAEGIAADECEGARSGGESAGHVGDEGGVRTIDFDGRHTAAPARKQLESNAARAGKEVKGECTVPGDEVFEHVKEVLLRKVGGGSGVECGRDLEASPTVDSSDNSHVFAVFMSARRWQRDRQHDTVLEWLPRGRLSGKSATSL